MEQKHKKHAALQKPNTGRFGRTEWAFVGAPCSSIQQLALKIATAFKGSYKVAYLDADHASNDQQPNQPTFNLEYTDKIKYHQLNTSKNWNNFDFKQMLDSEDLILVNGNHFPATKQVVIIEPVKEASLKKRTAELTNVELVLVKEGAQIYSWLTEILTLRGSNPRDPRGAAPSGPSEGPTLQDANIPTLKLEDTESIISFFKNKLSKALAPIIGLVLAGGKSIRMKQDKGLIDYHGQPQREYVFEMLSALTDSSWYSFRKGQGESYNNMIYDTFEGLGPFGAILSAFRKNPNMAYLAVACDYPNLDKAALEFLISKRDPSKIATCFYNPETDFPEPTICLWEPRAYARLLYFLSLGYACPRKVLINSDINMISYRDEKILNNVNTPEEYRAQLENMKVQNRKR